MFVLPRICADVHVFIAYHDFKIAGDYYAVCKKQIKLTHCDEGVSVHSFFSLTALFILEAVRCISIQLGVPRAVSQI
jgi:hypothetical protein